jgi:transcriptional regulator with XRE-family HTH domain
VAEEDSVLVNLKTAIAARGMRQVDLAMELTMPPSVLSEIVHCRRPVDPRVADRIAEILRADREWLFASITRIPAPKSEAEPTPALACTA